MNKATLLSIRLVLLSCLVIIGCSSDSLFDTKFPAGSNRGTGDVIDLQAVSGVLEIVEVGLPPVGNGEIKLTGVSVDDGSLNFSIANASLNTQQTNFENLKAVFEMWIAATQDVHRENPNSIAEGDPDFTWESAAEQATENIYDFQPIEKFQADGSFAPVAEGNYSVFLRITLKDNDTVVEEDAFLSFNNIVCDVNANFEPSDDVTLFSPPGDVPDPPKIINFAADPQTIRSGESATLYWWVSDTPKVLTIDNGVGDVIDSVRAEVSPTETTIYTLTASNDNGTVSQQVTVVVEQ